MSKNFGPWHAPTSCPNQKAGAFWIKRYRSSSTWSSSTMLNVMTSTGVEITRLIGDLHLLMVISSGWGYTYPSEKYEFVSWDYYSQLNGKIKFMFQTTNQSWYITISTDNNMVISMMISLLIIIMSCHITMSPPLLQSNGCKLYPYVS